MKMDNKVTLWKLGILVCGMLVVPIVPVHAAPAYRLVKTADDAKVFLVKENRRIHIPNPAVFEAGGYAWSDIETISPKAMNTIKNTALIKSPIDAKVYLIKDGNKEWIPDEATFLTEGFAWSDIVLLSQAQVDFYPTAQFSASAPPQYVVKQQPVVDAPVNPIMPSQTQQEARKEEITIQDIDAYTHPVPEVDNGSISESESLLATNNKGQKVVFVDSSNSPYFLDNGKKSRIPTLGGFSSSVNDMNDSGMVVGTSDVSGGGMDSGIRHAFLWQKGALKDLGTLGGEYSEANAVNNKGQIIGSSVDENNEWFAFIWEKGAMKKISADGQIFSVADDINDNGAIIGRLKIDPDACALVACKTKALLKDGHITYFDDTVVFSDINNFDEIVGVLFDPFIIDDILLHYTPDRYLEIAHTIGSGGLYGHAVVYTGNELVKLDDLVGDANIVFLHAKAINDRGEILATGFNYADRYVHEYLISLPSRL